MKAALLLLIACTTSRAQLLPPAQQRSVVEGIAEVYGLQHDRAIARFEAMTKQDSNDPAGFAYLAWAIWLKELAQLQELSIGRFADGDFFSLRERALSQIDAGAAKRIVEACQRAQELGRARYRANPRDKAALFLLGFSYQTMASYEVSIKRSWYSAFREGSKALRFHKELLRLDPQAHDARLAYGVYLYVSGSLKWMEKSVAWVLGFRGDASKGKRELEDAAARASLAGSDARVVLSLIYTREKQYDLASKHLGELRSKHPTNYMLPLEQAGLSMRRKDYASAIKLYRELLDGRTRVERALVYTRLGAAYRESGDETQATAWFARVLADRSASQRSLAVAHLELAKTLLKFNRESEARQHLEDVLKLPDVAGSRAEALALRK